jgi:GTP cyclohydrolase I
MCEHHMLPFSVKRICIYSKWPNCRTQQNSRIVDAFARRMQVQERLTDQIKNCIQEG